MDRQRKVSRFVGIVDSQPAFISVGHAAISDQRRRIEYAFSFRCVETEERSSLSFARAHSRRARSSHKNTGPREKR